MQPLLSEPYEKVTYLHRSSLRIWNSRAPYFSFFTYVRHCLYGYEYRINIRNTCFTFKDMYFYTILPAHNLIKGSQLNIR